MDVKMVESFSPLKRKSNVDEWSFAPTFTEICLLAFCIIIVHTLATVSSYEVILTLQDVFWKCRTKTFFTVLCVLCFQIQKSKSYIAKLCDKRQVYCYNVFLTLPSSKFWYFPNIVLLISPKICSEKLNKYELFRRCN